MTVTWVGGREDRASGGRRLRRTFMALLAGSAFLVLAGSTAVSASTAASEATPTSAGGGSGRGPDPSPGPAPEVLTVQGPFTATGQLLGGCGSFRQVVDGEGEWSALGAGTFHLDFCIQQPETGVVFPVLDGGTFTITAPEGTLSGTLDGYVRAGGSSPPGVGFPFRLELAVTAGTGRFATAVGTLVLDGAFSAGAVSAWGTISGTVSIPPGPPTSVNDCREGGWRDHVDDQGRPFRNQGHCIAYVLHHRP